MRCIKMGHPLLKVRYMRNVVLSLLFILSLSDAWSKTPKNLQKIQQSVFSVYSGIWQSTGFVIEENILVINFHMLIDIIGEDQMNVDSTRIRNKDGEAYSIENIIGADPIADLAFLRIKNYDGAALELDDRGGNRKDFFLIGFPDDKFSSIKMSKFADMSEVHNYFSYPSTKLLGGASGSPIVNNQGKVMAVLCQDASYIAIGTKIEKLQELLDKTRNQTIDHDDLSKWITGKINDLNLLAVQGN